MTTLPTKLTPENSPWMMSEAVRTLFEAFPNGSLRFVGGCVRNTLLGESVSDIDLAVAMEPRSVVKLLGLSSIRYIETGVDHGTVTAVIGGKPFEITSLRRDVETDGRRAVVAYTTDWSEDAQRRDLTFNALYADVEGNIYDPTSMGLSDLQERRLRFVGEANIRVQEDYLRILRFFRFLAWYGGSAKVDAASLRACRENRNGLKTLSVERVWSEIKKLLSASNPTRALHIMLTNEVLESVLPEATNVDGLEQLLALERRESLSPDPLLRLMAMSPREPLQMALLCKRMKMSNAETKRLRSWADDASNFDPEANERDRKIAIYGAGQQTALDRLYLRAAGEGDVIRSRRWMAFASVAKNWIEPEFPLSGKDLQAAGLKSGPQMGRAIEALKALWVRSGFTADKEKLLIALKMLG
ncbi:poly(A) polymerase [Litorimonas taeanensis]|uniref:Poly(A) polymerase n=1 Tax=Litorimonas taeanensis TaxID=568099 RepID=A0A420WJN8_9PROT|nr:CCA tRNA nucleotidyltransferase [Litorimonas taeanensis]RKQ71230.1 poly(A) polymerase [Litorimonas taeanensis]